MRVLVLAVALCLSGCTFSIARAIKAANDVNAVADAALYTCEVAYKELQKACLAVEDAQGCVDEVRERFDPLWDAHRAYRKAWIELEEALQNEDFGRVAALASGVISSEKQLERLIADALGPAFLDNITRR